MGFAYKTTRVEDLRVLKPGAHIRVIRGSSSSNEHGFYDHHMLVMSVVSGNQLQVIHYTQTGGEGMGSLASFAFGDSRPAEVIEETVTVKRDDKIELLEYKEDVKCFSADDAIQRARTKLGEQEYSVFSNNCECFVNWAITDKAVSNQVKGGLVNAGFGALMGALGGYFKEGGSWSEAAKGATSGATNGYTEFRKSRH